MEDLLSQRLELLLLIVIYLLHFMHVYFTNKRIENLVDWNVHLSDVVREIYLEIDLEMEDDEENES